MNLTTFKKAFIKKSKLIHGLRRHGHKQLKIHQRKRNEYVFKRQVLITQIFLIHTLKSPIFCISTLNGDKSYKYIFIFKLKQGCVQIIIIIRQVCLPQKKTMDLIMLQSFKHSAVEHFSTQIVNHNFSRGFHYKIVTFLPTI